jgi:hypothetical protein
MYASAEGPMGGLICSYGGMSASNTTIIGSLGVRTGSYFIALVSGGGPMANRESIVSSGGSAAVNAAITAMAALGGGLVRLDGLIDMDGDITMASNVFLVGYGPGTGLRNNTANAYAVNFIGAVPTSYGIAAPVAYADNFTCDTIGEAVNFVAGTAAIIEDDTNAKDDCQLVFIKTTGVAATGVVEIFDQISYPVGTWNSASVVLPLVFSKAGIFNLELQNTSSGSLTVAVQYAHTIQFSDLRLEETKITMSDCGGIDIVRCEFTAKDILTFANHVVFTGWVDRVSISECKLRGAVTAIGWTGSKPVRRISICDSYISGCTTAISLNPGTPGSTSASVIRISDNTIDLAEAPGSGGGNGIGIYIGAVSTVFLNVSGNTVRTQQSYAIDIEGAATGYTSRSNISSNCFGVGGVLLKTFQTSSFVGNYSDGSVTFQGTLDNLTISSNTIGALTIQPSVGNGTATQGIISGNFCGALSLYCTATYTITDFNITGNRVKGATYMDTGAKNLVMSSNYFVGNVDVGNGGSAVNSYLTMVGNTIIGTFIFTNTAQDGCIIHSNYVSSTQTIPSSSANSSVVNDSTPGAKVSFGSLTQANLIAMNGTAVSLIAAPAAGYIHIIDEIELFHDYATAVYTGGGDVKILYDASTVISLVDVGFVTGGADDKRVSRPTLYDLDNSTGTGTGFDMVTDSNKAIKITNDTAAFADGNASNIVKWKIKYHTAKLLT